MKIALFISRKNQLSVDCCIEIINLLGADNDISIDQAYKSYFSEDILSKVSFFDSGSSGKTSIAAPEISFFFKAIDKESRSTILPRL